MQGAIHMLQPFLPLPLLLLLTKLLCCCCWI
jgi:hypothetical protein